MLFKPTYGMISLWDGLGGVLQFTDLPIFCGKPSDPSEPEDEA